MSRNRYLVCKVIQLYESVEVDIEEYLQWRKQCEVSEYEKFPRTIPGTLIIALNY